MRKVFANNHKRALSLIFLVALWALFGSLFILSLTKPLYQDKGIFLAIGRGLSQGKIPNLDFWDHKTPGIYLIWSWLYPIFGARIILYKLFPGLFVGQE